VTSRSRAWAVVAFGLVALACHREGPRAETTATDTASSTSTAATSSQGAQAQDGACDMAAIGLGRAKPIGYRAPEGCSWKGGGEEPIRSEAAFHAAFGCEAPSGIDFAKGELRVVSRTLSPATIGIDVVDDGATITFVSRQRSPCPSEPPPMPIGVPIAYVAPAKAERRTADATCKVTMPCR